jgi:hypothetical protein
VERREESVREMVVDIVQFSRWIVVRVLVTVGAAALGG